MWVARNGFPSVVPRKSKFVGRMLTKAEWLES